MEQSMKSFENTLQKESPLETMIMYVGIGLYAAFKVMFGTFKFIFDFFICLFGLYVYLGLIGVVVLWVLDAILHGIAGR